MNEKIQNKKFDGVNGPHSRTLDGVIGPHSLTLDGVNGPHSQTSISASLLYFVIAQVCFEPCY